MTQSHTVLVVRIYGVSVVRDEADIIETTVRHLIAQGVDHLLIADNLSRDATRAVLDHLAAELPVTVVEDRDPAHRQSEKMTALAARAAEMGADWIVPFDADELWTGDGRTVREAIVAAPTDALAAPVADHIPRPTLRRGPVQRRFPWFRMSGYAKVAFRWQSGAVITDGNHSVEGVPPPVWGLWIDHYPRRSFEQYRRKVRQGAVALTLAGTPPEFGSHWHNDSALSNWRLRIAWWRYRWRPARRKRLPQ